MTTQVSSALFNAPEAPSSGNLLDDGDSFSNAIPLTVGEPQVKTIILPGTRNDYWIIGVNSQRTPLIYLNSSQAGDIDNFTISLYDNQQDLVSNRLLESEDPLHTKVYEFDTTYIGSYYIVVSFSLNKKSDYAIGVYVRVWGDSSERANRAALNTVQTDYFDFEWASESRYWQVTLNETQRCWLRFMELSSDVLEGSRVRVYRTSANPISEEIENGTGIIELTFRALGRGVYFIELIHNSQLDKAGDYQFFVNGTSEGYSFDTALKIQSGESLIETSRFGDPTYFFISLRENSRVSFAVRENSTGNLENAHVVIYEPSRRPLAIFYEGEQPLAGVIQANFTTTTTGTYFIVIEPARIAEIAFSIQMGRVTKAPSSEIPIWKPGDILFALLTFFSLPCLLAAVYLSKYGSFRASWEGTSPLKTCFEYFAVHDLYKRTTTNPYTSIDLVYVGGSSPIKVNMQFKELTPARTRISATRKRSPWDPLLGISLVFLCYFAISLISWLIIGDDLTPFNPSFALYTLLLFLFFGFLITFWLLEGDSLNSYFHFKSGVVDEIARLSEDFSYSSLLHRDEIPKHVDKEYQKKIHQARRAWNHARRDFRDGKKETFIIKADAAVRFVLEARVLQTSVYNPDDPPSELIKMAEMLRSKGFDIPSKREIEWFRNIRNRIVHSAGEVDDKTQQRAFDFYSKFINRLGLRS
ncbi:MAG: hypothetical protein ACE5OZ_05075 [Candidatus Heimdallarchaeota archaeon]